MNKYVIILKSWFPLATTVSLVCIIILITVQQSYRLSANDPQYQMVEDAVSAINKGTDPRSVLRSSDLIEVSQSLSPWLTICDTAGNIVASNATLDAMTLKIPRVAIDYVYKNGNDAVTWQPHPGVRQAVVGMLAKANRPYIVVAGRSLRKIEERTALLLKQVALGWGLSLIIILIVVVLQDILTGRFDKSNPIKGV